MLLMPLIVMNPWFTTVGASVIAKYPHEYVAELGHRFRLQSNTHSGVSQAAWT